MTGKLDVAHVHQLLRLVMEAQEICCDRPSREHHLISGLVRLVDAASTSAVFDTECALHAYRQRSGTVLIGWEGPARRSLEMPKHASRVFVSTGRIDRGVSIVAAGARQRGSSSGDAHNTSQRVSQL